MAGLPPSVLSPYQVKSCLGNYLGLNTLISTMKTDLKESPLLKKFGMMNAACTNQPNLYLDCQETSEKPYGLLKNLFNSSMENIEKNLRFDEYLKVPPKTETPGESSKEADRDCRKCGRKKKKKNKNRKENVFCTKHYNSETSLPDGYIGCQCGNPIASKDSKMKGKVDMIMNFSSLKKEDLCDCCKKYLCYQKREELPPLIGEKTTIIHSANKAPCDTTENALIQDSVSGNTEEVNPEPTTDSQQDDDVQYYDAKCQASTSYNYERDYLGMIPNSDKGTMYDSCDFQTTPKLPYMDPQTISTDDLRDIFYACCSPEDLANYPTNLKEYFKNLVPDCDCGNHTCCHLGSESSESLALFIDELVKRLPVCDESLPYYCRICETCEIDK